MKKYVNGEYIELTPEEMAEFQKYMTVAEVLEKSRPLTESEVTRLLITQQINTLAVDDHTALRMLTFYPEWSVQNTYSAGDKVQRNNKLWRAMQTHTSQSGWEPENTASLWEQINETHTGAPEDPIPYEGSLALEAGKYYIQYRVIYRCTRDSGGPLYHDLQDLVGLYAEVFS